MSVSRLPTPARLSDKSAVSAKLAAYKRLLALCAANNLPRPDISQKRGASQINRDIAALSDLSDLHRFYAASDRYDNARIGMTPVAFLRVVSLKVTSLPCDAGRCDELAGPCRFLGREIYPCRPIESRDFADAGLLRSDWARDIRREKAAKAALRGGL